MEATLGGIVCSHVTGEKLIHFFITPINQIKSVSHTAYLHFSVITDVSFFKEHYEIHALSLKIYLDSL